MSQDQQPDSTATSGQTVPPILDHPHRQEGQVLTEPPPGGSVRYWAAVAAGAVAISGGITLISWAALAVLT